MSIRIREVRVSFVWFERWGDIWSAAAPIQMEFLRSAGGFAKEFDQRKQDPTSLTPPWPLKAPQYQHWFWYFYLGRDPKNLTGALALRKLTPLRAAIPAKIRAQNKWIAVMADGFIYPHCIALVPTLRLFFDREDWPQEGLQTGLAMQNVWLASNEELYEVTWNGAKAAPAPLSGVVDTLLDHLRERVLGEGAAAGERTKLPFSVTSVVRGDTESIQSKPPDQGDVHRLLQGLCSLRKSWKDDKLAPLKVRIRDGDDGALLRVRGSAPDGHLLYHTDRGRAVWFPASFTAKGAFERSAGCYHRNLTLLHLQTEALLHALAARRDLLDSGAKVPELVDRIAKDAALLLSDIYSSGDETYRSSSARAYLDEMPSRKKLVNDALAEYKKDALKYEPRN